MKVNDNAGDRKNRAAPPCPENAAHEPKADALNLARNDNFVNIHMVLHHLAVAFRPEVVALVVLLLWRVPW